MKSIKLRSGNEMPLLGLGTWRLSGKQCTDSVAAALETGYRHIDTADAYENHKDIAKALEKSNLNRDELFITSKIWRDRLHFDQVISDTERFLDELGVQYLDLLLIHWPNADMPLKKSLKALKEVKESGLTKDVGVSNFTINHLKDALDYYPELITLNQVEFHPSLYQKELLEFCRENDIALTAYSPLGRGADFNSDVIKELSQKYDKTPAQLILKWLVDKDIAAIPKASSKSHLEENFEVFGWDFPEEARIKIDQLNKDNRIIDPGFGEFDY
jgi:diketogulonate reductase-like aldo/keto reductase